MEHMEELRHYLAPLGAESLAEPRLRLHRVRPGQHILEQGAPIDQLFLLCEGRLKVCSVSEGGRYVVVARSTPPQFLGDIEFFDGLPALHSVIAESEAVLIGFPLSLVRTELTGSIDFYRFMCRVLMGKLYRTSRAYSASLLYPAKNRLALYLLQNAGPDGTLRLVGVQTAALLGITPRHLSRLLSHLQQENLLVQLRPKVYQLTDRAALEQLAALPY